MNDSNWRMKRAPPSKCHTWKLARSITYKCSKKDKIKKLSKGKV